MTHTYSKSLFHLVWSTKNRELLIDASIENDLYKYIHGHMKNKKCNLHIINGMPDHVHLLVGVPLTVTVSDLVQQIKVSSTRWMRNQGLQLGDFAWQEGFGAFTVGYSNFENVKSYIANQKEHHRTKTFEEEYLEFLRMLDISYDK